MCHAPRERVSWNPFHIPRYRKDIVTLHVSVWVEIWNERHRGTGRGVTLHVSVWVEILCVTCAVEFMSHAPRERVSWNRKIWSQSFKALCHAPRERVSWNAWYVMQIRELQVSRSTWACELKLKNSATQAEPIVSRSTWACELKYVKLWLVSRGFSHAPRERVSWNMFFTRYTFMY